MKILYKCENCGYETNRLLNYRRHDTRKTPCYNKTKGNIDKYIVAPNVNAATPNVNATAPNVNAATPNVNAATPNVNAATTNNSLQCLKCLTVFSRREKLNYHNTICDGTHKLQCKLCLKMFVTRQGKSQHMKYVKCNPPLQQVTNNNITNNINITNTTNNINIRVDFGEECLEKLCEDKEYIKKMIDNINLGKYAIPKSIEEIYFNDKYPENQTLKKARKNDKMVSIQYNGKWETRFYEDIMDDLVKKTEEYHEIYFKDLQKKYEKIEKDREFRKLMIPIRRFANRMLWFGWKCDDIRSLGLELDEGNDMDEDDFIKMLEYQKEIKQLMIDKIYDKSTDLQVV